MIYFKNTLSGKIEEFKSITPGVVGMYNCGPTVYGKPHIGNLRAYVFADLIKNTLTYNDYSVNQIINITDVGHLVSDDDEGADKVEEQAKKEHLNATDITKKYTQDFFDALTLLNIDTSTITFPKATEHIQEQIDLIKELELKGYTYAISDGVYFDTSRFPTYGELGNINIKGLQEGARIESNTEKKNSTDFSLWKFSKEKRQQEWESPWGIGFPGWHIECSAMAHKYLGVTFDIHTGGVDHIPTHHQNEIAQSKAAFDAPLANYWLHVNHITIDGKKISKSIGNTLYLEDFEKHAISPLAYKYWLYTSHYSTLSNFTLESVRAAQVGFEKIKDFLVQYSKENVSSQTRSLKSLLHKDESVETYKQNFLSYINNDLNTPKAIALIFDLLKDSSVTNENKKNLILDFDRVFKLGLDVVEVKEDALIPQNVLDLAQRRKSARDNKDFALSDALREEIEKAGYIVKDMSNEEGFVLEEK
jgi:cysteinyl-tRNA synthetase